MLSCSKTAKGGLKYIHAFHMLAFQTIYIFPLTWHVFRQFWTFLFSSPSSSRRSKVREHEAHVKRIQEHFVILERLIALFIDPTVKQKSSAWPFGAPMVMAMSVEPWPVVNYCLWYWEHWQFNHSTVSIENSIYLKRWYCFPSKWQSWQMGQKHCRRLNKEIEREPLEAELHAASREWWIECDCVWQVVI